MGWGAESMYQLHVVMACDKKDLRPCPDLVPMPGHCALALKGMLLRHRGAISFVSICCGVAILSPPKLQITGKHG